MIRILFFPILGLFFNIVSAQNLNFESVVLEKSTSNPVEGAIVAIEETTLAVKTNEEGIFKFEEAIPYGEHVVTVSKENYETEYFLIESVEGKRILVDKITMKITKDEASRRKKLEKKNKKANEEKIKEAKRNKEKKDKLLAKKKKRLKKKNTVEVIYDSIPVKPEITYTATQKKYAKILEVPVENLTNNKLYEFIDEWMGVTYLMGGATKEGIDCSSFTQRLYTTVYDLYIERTARKQYDSKSIDKFTDKEKLDEGDLMFFEGMGANKNEITHVGVYLGNYKFVHSTSVKQGREKGVKISDLRTNFWSKRFVCGGWRTDLE